MAKRSGRHEDQWIAERENRWTFVSALYTAQRRAECNTDTLHLLDELRSWQSNALAGIPYIDEDGNRHIARPSDVDMKSISDAIDAVINILKENNPNYVDEEE